MKITVDGEPVLVSPTSTRHDVLLAAGIAQPGQYDLIQIINGKHYVMSRGTLALMRSDEFITARKSASNG